MDGKKQKTFGSRLREARKQVALSKNEIATLLGKSTRTIDNHESGRNAPSPADIRQYAEIYGVTIRWLTTGEPSSIPNENTDAEILKGVEGGLQGKDELAKILMNRNPTYVKAILANLHAFAAALENEASVDRLERENGELREYIKRLKRRIESQEREIARRVEQLQSLIQQLITELTAKPIASEKRRGPKVARQLLQELQALEKIKWLPNGDGTDGDEPKGH